MTPKTHSQIHSFGELCMNLTAEGNLILSEDIMHAILWIANIVNVIIFKEMHWSECQIKLILLVDSQEIGY